VYNTYYSGSLVVGTTTRLTNQDLSVMPQLPGPQNCLSRMTQNYWHKARASWGGRGFFLYRE